MIQDKMIFKDLQIPGLKLFTPKKFYDERGFFSETYNSSLFEENGSKIKFVQDNHSLSVEKWTIRGFHYQIPPYAQDKLVRVISGAILDIAIDIRRDSPTFGKYVEVELTASSWSQFLVPIGFAHGFVTLSDNTEVLYKVSNFYSPSHDRGIYWEDPTLNIQWPMKNHEALVSEKDKKLPLLDEIISPFGFTSLDEKNHER